MPVQDAQPYKKMESRKNILADEKNRAELRRLHRALAVLIIGLYLQGFRKRERYAWGAA
jgi:hypothetical protein